MNKEVFYLKVDVDSGIDGFVLLNRQDYHTGTMDNGILHDLFEHPYKPIKNPYLDEIAALGAYNEYRVRGVYDITDELDSFFVYCFEQESFRFKWDVKYLNCVNEEVFETVELIKHRSYHNSYQLIKFVDKYKYLFSYYFNLGADIFNKRFSNYFNNYYDLYNDIGNQVLDKLRPLAETDLDNIKLTIDYKDSEVKVEY